MVKGRDQHFDEEYNPDGDMFETSSGEGESIQLQQDQGSEDPFNFSAETSAPQPAAKAPAPTSRSRPPSPLQGDAKADKRLLGMTTDVPVQMVAVLGKKTMTIRDILGLTKGRVVELNRFPNEAIDLVANGKLMAKGELVEIDGKLGVRIIKIFE